MTSGFGVDRSADGTSGTTAADIRKIWGGLYSPGIINGCTITRSSSGMTYTVAAGVVAIQTGAGEVVLAPVPAATKTVAGAGGTARTDIIYAQQRYPSIEGDAEVVVNVGSSLPARSVALGQFSVPANATNTAAAVATGGLNFSIPHGASLGVLHKYVDTTVGKYPNGITRKGAGTIHVPTDRRLVYRISTVLWANGSVGFDNAHYAEYAFLPNIDGDDFAIWTTPGLHQAWATLIFEGSHNVAAGTHTVGYGQFRMSGNTDVYGYYGTDGNGYGRDGTIFTVTDGGPIV